MSNLKVLSILVFVILSLSGCGPKCQPIPDLAYRPVTALGPLPFRVSGISYRVGTEADCDYGPLTPYSGMVRRVTEITNKTFINPEIEGHADAPAVSIQVAFCCLSDGDPGLFSNSPSRYDAKFRVLDVEDGHVLFEKLYSAKSPWKLEVSKSCTVHPNALRAFDECVQVVNDMFLQDVKDLNVPKHLEEVGRIHGTFKFVTVSAPVTPVNIRWKNTHSNQYVGHYLTKLICGLTSGVTRRVHQGKLFDHSADHEYLVKIVLTEIRSTAGGLFDDSYSNDVAGFVVIFRDGKEASVVKLKRGETSTNMKLDHFYDYYSERVYDALEELPRPEAI